MDQERIQNGGNEGEGQNSPLSRAEELIQAHPDITVIRFLGDIYVTQTFPHRWRNITVDVAHEKDSQRHYPTVLVSAWDGPRNVHDTSDLGLKIRSHGLTTVVKLHLEDNEQVTPEVGYRERIPYPNEGIGWEKFDIEKYAYPIPAQELVATARTGLEMLKAYQETSRQQRTRIMNLHTGFHGRSQIVDDTRPDMDAYIAAASPVLGAMMKQGGISYTHVGARAIYALNALNKVTDAMLPSEIPTTPQNRRERRHRGTPGLSPAPGRRPAGR